MVKHLLPIQNNQVVNLKTGQVEERQRNHFFTVECPVSLPENKTDELRMMINDFFFAMMNTHEKTKVLQTILGLGLTGENVKRLFVFIGSGNNGKSIVSRLMRLIMGSFYCVVDKHVFIKPKIESKGNEHNEPLYSTKGKRLGMCAETKDGDKFHDDNIKVITGGDTITTRGINKSQEEFISFLTCILYTNHAPQFELSDKAMKSRVDVLEFNTIIRIDG